jgi:adenylylsulfate kinase
MSGVVMWFTGLPSSGKSTLAKQVCQELTRRGSSCVVLDSDEVRELLSPAPGFDVKGRRDFYRTLAQLAAMLARQGHIVLVPATAHRRFYRALARRLAPRFVEVFVDTPKDECRRRDSKGLYENHLAALPGDGLKYERPQHPDVLAKGGSSERAVQECMVFLA